MGCCVEKARAHLSCHQSFPHTHTHNPPPTTLSCFVAEMDRGDQESKDRSGELSGHVEFQQHWGAQLSRTKTSPKVGEPDDSDLHFVSFSIKSPFSASLSSTPNTPRKPPGVLSQAKAENAVPKPSPWKGHARATWSRFPRAGVQGGWLRTRRGAKGKDQAPCALSQTPLLGTFTREDVPVRKSAGFTLE